jgi:NTP pyrophosphatase (non-canonical NTP hydrolase)
MSDIEEITRRLMEFRDARDWSQFHDSKNLALAISLEAAELNELFLWKTDLRDIEGVDPDRISEELADVLAFAFLLAERHGLNIRDIVMKKIEQNEQKYPVKKSKGTSRKYTDL